MTAKLSAEELDDLKGLADWLDARALDRSASLLRRTLAQVREAEAERHTLFLESGRLLDVWQKKAEEAETRLEQLTSFCPDLLADLHAIFTSHGIASRGQRNLASDVIAWAAMGTRQTHNEVIAAILRDPHGCRFCDSGKLRSPDKDHDATCGYKMAAMTGHTLPPPQAREGTEP